MMKQKKNHLEILQLFLDILFMAVVILYGASAFQLHVTQKPLAEAFSPRNPHPTETLAKRQTTSVKNAEASVWS